VINGTNIWNLYFANLGAYSEGKLVGGWVDVMDFVGDQEGLAKEVKRVTSGADEVAIHDYEDTDLGIGENADIEGILCRAEAVEEFGFELVDIAIGHHLSPSGIDLPAIQDAINDGYYGYCKKVSDFAHDFYQEQGCLIGIPEHLAYHIDWSGVARELEEDFFFHESKDGGFIVWRR
jgi:antirestriction protein